MMKLISWMAALFVALHLSVGDAAAALWVGGTGSWTTPSNWSPAGLPSKIPPVDADIQNGMPQLSGGAIGEANNVRLGAQLSIFANGVGPGQLYTNQATIGDSNDPRATVSGTGSAWVNEGLMIVGYKDQISNAAVLEIQNGGAVSTGSAIIGDFGSGLGFDSAFGVVNVEGSNSRWNVLTEVRVGNAAQDAIGNSGGGFLNVRDGGTVISTTSYIGYHPVSTGWATVGGTGAAATWEAGDLVVGRQAADARLIISGNGTVTSNVAVIGDLVGGTGVASVAGTWSSGSDLIVGRHSSALNTLNVLTGGAVSSNRGFIGDFAGARGIVNVGGSGAAWDSGSELRVGNLGIGTLSVTSDADVTNGIGRIGVGAGAMGNVTVSGTGSTWTNTGNLIVGFQSGEANTLNIHSGGVVTSSSGFIGDDVTGIGIVNVDGANSLWNADPNGGSALRVGNLGKGTLNITSGGQVKSSLGRVSFAAGSHGEVSVSGPNSNWTVRDDLNIGGGGDGKLTLGNGGFVKADLGVSISPGGPATPGGRVEGNGTIIANNVVNSGIVHPGPAVSSLAASTLSITGDYIQTASGTLHIDLDNGDNSRLSVNGNVSLDGKLDVENIPNSPIWTPAIGDSFHILSWTGSLSGAFDLPLGLPKLPGSREWNTSQLYTTGVISVVSSAGLPGDYNNNGVVDAADFTVWRDSLGQTGPGLAADGNLDNQIDDTDHDIWKSHFGESAGSGSGGTMASSNRVPEPASALALIFGVGFVCCRVRQLHRSYHQSSSA